MYDRLVKTWTAAELERMTPAERKALSDAAIVFDLESVPEAFLSRVRHRHLSTQRASDPTTP